MGRTLLKMTALTTLLALAAAACGGGVGDGDAEAAARSGGKAETDGPEVQGEPPTPEALAGIWWNESRLGVPSHWGHLMVRFSPEGEVAIDCCGNFHVAPNRGRYEVDGRTINFPLAGGAFAWEAGIAEDGRLHTVTVSDNTRHVPPGVEWTWVRVSPSSPAAAEIAAETPAGAGPPPSREAMIFGVWLLEGTGHLLSLSEGGTYAIADEGRLGTADPDDEGTFELDGEGRLTFTVGEKSRDCAEGASWAWEDVRLVLGEGTLRGVESKDDCEKGLGPDLTWIRLSP